LAKTLPACCSTRSSTLRTVSGAVAPDVPAIVVFGTPSDWRIGAPSGVTTATAGLLESNVKVIGATGVSVLPLAVPKALSSAKTSSV
jgi:hypothetical protein